MFAGEDDLHLYPVTAALIGSCNCSKAVLMVNMIEYESIYPIKEERKENQFK